MRHRHLLDKPSGFTLTELVTVLLLIGVLAAAAAPLWFNRTDIEQRGWFDQLLQATRYAQKLALASNCAVRITINSGDFTLQQPVTHCDTAGWQSISLPGSSGPYIAPTGVAVTAGIGTITFYGNGLASVSRTITVTGTHNLSFAVHATTGYVERL